MRQLRVLGRPWRLLWGLAVFVVAGVTALLSNQSVWMALAAAVIVSAILYGGLSAGRLRDEHPAFPGFCMRRLPWALGVFVVLCVIALISRQALWVAIAVPAVVSAFLYGVSWWAPVDGER